MSNSSKTQMTRSFRIIHSLWILLSLVPLGLTCFGSFFYIGIRANQRKWMIFGFIYLVLITGSFMLINAFDTDHFLTDIGVGILLFGWVSSIVFSFAVREQFLRIMFRRKLQYENGLSSMAANKIIEKEEIKQVQSQHVTDPQEKVPKQALGKITPKKKIVTTSPPKVININRATEREIRALPSIHGFLAKKIVAARKGRKPYRTIEEVAESIKVLPHILKKATPYIAFRDEDMVELENQLHHSADKEQESKQGGRLVDY